MFSQPADGAGGLIASSWVDPPGSDADMYVYDDFTLASAEAIQEVDWRGGYIHGAMFGAAFDFTVTFFASIAGGSEPLLGNPQLEDTAPIYLVKYWVGGNAGETPAGTFGGTAMYDYRFVLPTPFQAAAGTKYWVRIEASQPSYPDWGIAVGTGGDATHYQFSTGAARFSFAGGDTAFALLAVGTGTTTTTVTTTSTVTTSSTVVSTSTTSTPATSTTSTTLAACAAVVGGTLKVTHVGPPPGDDGLTFTGTFAVTPPVAPALDPVGTGIGVRLIDAATVVLDARVPSGAFDRATKTGWKVNKAATRWTYVGPKTGAVGGVVNVVLVDKSANAPGVVAFTIRGKAGSYAAGVHVAGDVVLPASGRCFESAFPATPPAKPSCTIKNGTLKCH